MLNIAVLISGSGTNLQAIIDNTENGIIDGSVRLVISNKANAYGLERAKKHKIKNYFINSELVEDFDGEIMKKLEEEEIDLVVLAGYLKVLSPEFIRKYENRIINIHPSLIPSFCGKGYYGERVHKAVIDSGVKISGATVHFVDEGTDTGPIISQASVDVLDNYDYIKLQAEVLKLEHKLLVESLKCYCQGKIKIEGGKVKIEK